MNEINWMQQGWECPKCGAVMAPHVSCCVNCRGNKGDSTVTTNADSKWADFLKGYEEGVMMTSGKNSSEKDKKENPEEQWERYYLNI